MIITSDYVFPIVSEPIKNGFVQTDASGRILSVGRMDDELCVRFGVEGEEIIACQGFIVPGFTNAHCHLELSYLKGMFKQGTGMDGFIQQINALRTTIEYDGRMKAMREALDEMSRQGVTCMGDISNSRESFELKKAALADGRMYTRTFIELFGTEPEEAQEILQTAVEKQEYARGLGIDAAPTPHSCYTMSPLLNRITAAEGLKSGFISYHNQESSEEEDMLRYGTGALAEDYRGRGTTQLPVTGTSALVYFIENLKDILPAPFEGNLLLVHNVSTDQESIDAALQNIKHPYWVLCPLSNIFIHRMLPPVDLFRRNHLKICVGTDSLSSNLQLDMVAEMKCLQDHFSDVSLNEILSWACLNGAEAIGCSAEYGSFEAGKIPGVVLIEDVDIDNLKLTDKSKSIRLL